MNLVCGVCVTFTRNSFNPIYKLVISRKKERAGIYNEGDKRELKIKIRLSYRKVSFAGASDIVVRFVQSLYSGTQMRALVLWPVVLSFFLEGTIIYHQTIPAYYAAGMGKMLKNIISFQVQLPEKSVILSWPGISIQRSWANDRGAYSSLSLCTNAEETGRLYVPLFQHWQWRKGWGA